VNKLAVNKTPTGNKRFAAQPVERWSNEQQTTNQLQSLGGRFKTEIWLSAGCCAY